jgi:hypothetical protein
LKTAKLVFWSAVGYAVLLILARGIFPEESTPTLALAGIPLIIVAFIIARDLSQRSSNPSTTPIVAVVAGFKEDPVKFLAGQLRVASNASDSYIENIIRSRLRELLVSKISLETGYDAVSVRRKLSDPKEGAALLRDAEFYRVLYGRLPATRLETMKMIENAIDLIGVWKG